MVLILDNITIKAIAGYNNIRKIALKEIVLSIINMKFLVKLA